METGFLVYLLSFLFLLSCSNDSVINVIPETEKESLASFIGKEHNLFLDDFYQKIGNRLKTKSSKNGVEEEDSVVDSWEKLVSEGE